MGSGNYGPLELRGCVMYTLLLRLSGPMQSWGLQSRFEHRDTVLEPTKSGVIGLLCAALGRDREESIDDLAALRMGVRVDQEGQLRSDYQTAQWWKYQSNTGRWQIAGTTLSSRYYLADARFLVGFESSDVGLLEKIDRALRAPRWPLFLGRKAFPPGEPVYLQNGGVRHVSLEEALRNEPWRCGNRQSKPDRLRLVIERDQNMDEVPDGDVILTRPDQPLSFADRSFSLRTVIVRHIPVPQSIGGDADVSQ